ncbi:MaoC family dehydratase N-terminal domain-containing protein [Nocardioides carbamazepini]|uniref:MaoC family dehydratase N-terminal domain-containing protein n=1 Tax=Nocardioides carbamazepini TaxID=2854259 RepID=UPI002149F4DD|nr:MaoC family dehydratase N-terminal domain-containing protein [Nocardioides carbamazepini]MCR1785049.1 MaoC family dehydratase N-terminal domain-containing protein [Nocardioides carbamazepini]
MSALLTPALEAVVGGEVRRRTSYPVGATEIRRWAVAVSWPAAPPAYYLDADPAALVAPGDFNPFAWAAPEDTLAARGLNIGDPGWIEKVLDVEPPAVSHQLNGAVEDEYLAPVRPGDVITSRTTLAGYKERTGRLGPMLITTLADTWTNQAGAVVKRASMTLIRH